jgi:ubiquinone/menaquinone biosynthesis C-methylase UbiE
MMAVHDQVVQREFRKQANSFEDPSYQFRDRQLMGWILENVPIKPGSLVLDVAAGTGHIARAIAPQVRQVVAVDLTQEMLTVGRASAEAEGIKNVIYELGDAAALSYLENSFDLVVTRFSVHHFEDPSKPLEEMVRVCRPAGRIAIIDVVVRNAQVAERHNALERLSDPSHTRALPGEELIELLEASGADLVHSSQRDRDLDLERWVSQAQAGSAASEAIRFALRSELEGDPATAATGLRPYLKGQELTFKQPMLIAVAEKPDSGNHQ